MRLIKGITTPSLFKNGCVLTIGNFDGVHLGHKAVIEKLAERGKAMELPVVLMIFEPQPLEYFQSDTAPPRLSRLREKVLQLAKLPVDDLIVVRFNKQFADRDATQFIEQILVKGFNVKHLVIGDDFRFGKDRKGNFALLVKQGPNYGFTVEDTGSFCVGGDRVSSTLIRAALAEGNLKVAEAMLGYPYSISGIVSHGHKRGRELGFPTANIKIFRKNCPVNGVFAITMTGLAETPIEGIANIGIRPTVEGDDNVILEAHLFNFDRDIYGRYVTVNLKQKIRAERRFQSVSELKAQIVEDVAEAKQFFATQTLPNNG